MALRQPDKIKSNNPNEYGIADADEVSGHRSVTFRNDLLKIPDAILSKSGINDRNDAMGQWWYVVEDKCFYQLVDWGSRHARLDGWKKLTAMTNPVATINGNAPDEEGNVTIYGYDLPYSQYDDTPLSKKIFPIPLSGIVDNVDIRSGVPMYDAHTLVFDKGRGIILAENDSGTGLDYYDSFPGDSRVGKAPELGKIYIIFSQSRVFIGVKDGLCELFKTEEL